jgi:hypothetical protein
MEATTHTLIATVGQESRSGPYSVKITPYGAVNEDRFKVEITYHVGPFVRRKRQDVLDEKQEMGLD